MNASETQNPARLTLVRHGAVDNPDQIYYGRLPNFGLSQEGRQEAQRAAGHLRHLGVDRIFHSPLLRTTQTALILSNGVAPALPIAANDLLLEVSTPFDGQTLEELALRNWDMYTGNIPPYEQPADILRRSRRFIEQTLERHGGEHIVAVTHGDVIAFTILWVLGREMTVENKQRFLEFGLPEEYPATGSTTTLHFHGPDWPAQVSLRYFNPSRQSE